MAKQKKRDWGQVWKFRGKWTARWWEGGKLRQKSFAGAKSVAERFLALKRVELEKAEADGLRPLEPMRSADFLDRYEELFTGEKMPSTIVRETSTLKPARKFFGRMMLDKIRRADIEAFLTKRTAKDKIAPATRNRLLSALSSLFAKAVALNHCRLNPCAGVKMVRETKKDVPYLDLDEQQALVDACAPSLRDLVAVLLDCGLRLGEALRLELRDIDWTRQTLAVRIAKSKRPRTVPFTQRGKAALRSAVARRGEPRVPDRLFWDMYEPRKAGELGLRTKWRKAWNKARKAVGHPSFRLHDCRHVWASTMLRAGVPPNDLARLGGWGSLSMLDRYAMHVPQNAADMARQRLQAHLAGTKAQTRAVP